MIRPTEADVGRQVVYQKRVRRHYEVEEGVITSFNDEYVFVRYGANAGSAATRREDLEWSRP